LRARRRVRLGLPEIRAGKKISEQARAFPHPPKATSQAGRRARRLLARCAWKQRLPEERLPEVRLRRRPPGGNASRRKTAWAGPLPKSEVLGGWFPLWRCGALAATGESAVCKWYQADQRQASDAALSEQVAQLQAAQQQSQQQSRGASGRVCQRQ